MAQIMISLKHKYWELIKQGKKTLELRKGLPIQYIDTIYIYETKSSGGCGKVVGEIKHPEKLLFQSELWDDETYENISIIQYDGDGDEYVSTLAEDDDIKNSIICKDSCLSICELRDYIGTGVKRFSGYVFNPAEVVVYDKPLEIYHFMYVCPHKDKPMYYDDCEKAHCKYFDGGYQGCDRDMKKAPQNWCYCDKN